MLLSGPSFAVGVLATYLAVARLVRRGASEFDGCRRFQGSVDQSRAKLSNPVELGADVRSGEQK